MKIHFFSLNEQERLQKIDRSSERRDVFPFWIIYSQS